MAITYLMDSNVLIDYTSRKFPTQTEGTLDKIFDTGFHFSIISRMEVLGFDAPTEILKKLDEFLSIGIMYPLSKEIADACILIRRKHPKVKLPDAIIAANAILYHHTLLTSDVDDFKNIEGLTIENPRLLQ